MCQHRRGNDPIRHLKDLYKIVYYTDDRLG